METGKETRAAKSLRRLGRNAGRYCGETLRIDSVIREIDGVARGSGWESECFLEKEGWQWCGYHWKGAGGPRLYVSSGIHGDEPAGPLAILHWLREGMWPKEAEVWLCPCLNPTGFTVNRRENLSGTDLNRDYRHFQAEEVRAHTAWLRRLPEFDLSLLLHEDWEAEGFYLYELNPRGLPSHARAIINLVSAACPVDVSEQIDGWPADAGVIRPGISPESRSQWPEALFLIKEKTSLSYTLEAPSDFPLPVRVGALVRGLEILNRLRRL